MASSSLQVEATQTTLAQQVYSLVSKKSFDYYYTGYWHEHGDPRVAKSVLLGGGPWQMLSLVASYLLLIKLVGPAYMRHRKPVANIDWLIRAYNAFMVAFNTYLFVAFSRIINFGLNSFGCDAQLSLKTIPDADLLAVELYLLSRYFDFFDSFFFVLRKKYAHLSLLHVAHHTAVPIIIWTAGHFYANPLLIFAGYINLPIHMLMYTYYGLSTFESLKKYLWWKKYITGIQIVQFVIDLAHSIQALTNPKCPKYGLIYVEFLFSITFLYLFGQFYVRSYLLATNNAAQQASKQQASDNSTSSNNQSQQEAKCKQE